jgi:hypothetical protein
MVDSRNAMTRPDCLIAAPEDLDGLRAQLVYCCLGTALIAQTPGIMISCYSTIVQQSECVDERAGELLERPERYHEAKS